MASLRFRDVLPSSIIPTLASYAELSQLNSYVNASTQLFNLLNTATNFTFLAPTNDAINQWISSQGNSTPSADVIEATLSYHLLNGSWPTVVFGEEPQFVPTSLTNSSYSNVTIYPAGQRVELLSSAGVPEIITSNKTAATISSKDVVCLNGLIQIINSVLSIPTSIVQLTAEANMSFFIAMLNRANFLSLNDAGVINFVDYASFTPNMTFFIPQTAAALVDFDAITTNISASNLTALFDYHIVPNHVIYSPDFVNGTVLTTAQGDNLTITVNGNDTYINSAKILTPDYLIVNGVIHTIDTLLDRFNQTIPPQPVNTTATSSDSSSSSSGLSTGGKAAIGVVIPLVALAALAGLFWFWRKRKTRRYESDTTAATASEISGKPAAKELSTGQMVTNELASKDPTAKELAARDPPAKELHTEHKPLELATGYNSFRPIELE